MQWYYSKNGSQLGPVEEHELRAKIATGDVLPTDLVWREGMVDWIASSRVAELSGPVGPGGPPATIQGGLPDSPYAPPRVAPQAYHPAGAPIPNYLWQSIVVTILCCWPFGIPAIVNAAKVDNLVSRGDIPGAMAASANAKKWCIYSLVGWGIAVVLYVLVIGLGAAASR